MWALLKLHSGISYRTNTSIIEGFLAMQIQVSYLSNKMGENWPYCYHYSVFTQQEN